MARPYNANPALIHVDVNYSAPYIGLINVNLSYMQKLIPKETDYALIE